MNKVQVLEKELTPAGESSVPEMVQKDKSPVNIDLWIETRKEFITKVGAMMVEKSDYHVIQGRKSLAKGGAEKLASIFGWQAEFIKDSDSVNMFGDQKGLVCFICNLTKDGIFVGQGRGAASLLKNASDPNKTLKMAQKSAFIDAVIRSSGLSDIYTQDLEDMAPGDIGAPQQPVRSYKPSDKQMDLIKKLMEQKGYTKQDLMDEGFTRLDPATTSELIGWLLAAKSKVDPNGDPIAKEIADGINY